MRAVVSLVALSALVSPVASAGAADAVLHVRARLRVDIDTIERVPGGLGVQGSLRDDVTDEPVPGRTVAISVEGEHGFYHYAEPSGPDGTFRWRVPLPLGSYRLRVAAGGDGDYAGAPPIDRTVDVARRTPTLTLHLPERVAAHAPSLHAAVEAQESDGAGSPRAFDGRATLAIAGRAGTTLAFSNGHAEVDVFGPFGRPGDRVEVTVAIEPDPLHNGARASRSLLLTTPTTLTLVADGTELAPDGQLAVSGRLHDDDGPIGGAEIVFAVANGRELGRAVTDGGGHYGGWVRGRDLPAGIAFIEARHRPLVGWREPSVSPTVPVRVLPAPPVGVWPYLVSPALTLLAGAVVFAARNRRWRALLVRRRAHRAAAAPPPLPGLTESRPRLLSSLRARADHGVTGVVVDAADDRPIPTASVVARSTAGDTRATTVDERGRFAIEELPAGALVVEIAAPGYVAERFTRTLPHRGELRGARVRLVPVRARIFDAWRRAATSLSPTARAGETMTPRELWRLVEARRRLPQESLAALTTLVESAVWGAHAPSTEELAAAERLVAQLEAGS